MVRPPKGRISLKFEEDDILVEDVALIGEDFNVVGEGRADYTGRIENLAVKRFQLGDRADFSMSAMRGEDQTLRMSLSGRSMTIGPLVERYFRTQTDPQRDTASGDRQDIDWGRGVRANLRLDQLHLRDGVAIRDVSLDIWRGPEQLRQLELAGFDMALNPMSMKMVMSDEDGELRRIIEAESTNIGELLRGIFGISSIQGGNGALTLKLASMPGDPLDGILSATGFKVVGAPLLAKLFAAGSFDGLRDLLDGEGIALEDAQIDFSLDEGRFYSFQGPCGRSLIRH